MESIKTKGKKVHKKVWIDSVEFFVLKAEFYTKSGRLSKTIDMSELTELNGVIFPQKIEVEDLRKKISFSVNIENLNTELQIAESEFQPKAL